MNQILRYIRNYLRKEQRRSKSLGAMVFFGLLAAILGLFVHDQQTPETKNSAKIAQIYQKERPYKCALNRVIDGDSVILECDVPAPRKEEGNLIDSAIDAVKDLVISASPELEKIAKSSNTGQRADAPTVKQKTEIRVWGIDAPELGQKPWGDRSKKEMQSLTGKKGSPITLYVRDIDQYNRVVGQLYSGHLTKSQFTQSRDLGLQLVKAGEAVVYRRFNRDPAYQKAAENAQAKALGIWSTPGDQQDPGKWRQLNGRNVE